MGDFKAQDVEVDKGMTHVYQPEISKSSNGLFRGFQQPFQMFFSTMQLKYT